MSVIGCGIVRLVVRQYDPSVTGDAYLIDDLFFSGGGSGSPPVVTCPADVGIECDESSDPSNTGTATATGASPTVTSTDNVVSGDCPNDVTITRTWTATDASGQTSSCDQIINTLSTLVAIDIKPGTEPNCFSRNGHGVIPVAILGSASFDATQVDETTVELEGLGIKMAGKSGNLLAHVEDVNGDGIDDLVVQIEDDDGVMEEGDATTTLCGVLFDGRCFEGSDSICVIP